MEKIKELIIDYEEEIKSLYKEAAQMREKAETIRAIIVDLKAVLIQEKEGNK